MDFNKSMKIKAKIILALILAFSMSLLFLSACAIEGDNQAPVVEDQTSRAEELVSDKETKLPESDKADLTGCSDKTDAGKASTERTGITQESPTAETGSSAAATGQASNITVVTAESTSEKTSEVRTEAKTSSGKIVVSLSVNCVNAVKANVHSAAGYAPDGVMLFHKEIVLDPGSTVFDVLKKSDYVINASNNLFGTYVSAIQGISEGAAGGGKGGWVYSVNGVFPNYSVSSVKVETGDEVSFHYTVTPGDVPGSPF